VSAAGSYRRGKETVHDLDFLVATKEPALVCEDFTTLPHVSSIIVCGDTKASVRLKNGLQCDLRAVSNAQFPFALQYFTGSKEHNVAIRSLALKQGLSLNEYGFTPTSDSGADAQSGLGGPPRDASPANDASPAGEVPAQRSGARRSGYDLSQIFEESDIYRALGLDFIPPEIRENRGEIEAAADHTLPRLIELEQLRGTFHNHTTASDGRDSLEAMAEEAMDLGLQYLGIADHSKASFQANGLDETRLLEQVEAIHKLNATYGNFRIFSGTEVDILKDGTLDFSDEILARLDYCVASVHASFTLSEDEMTRRICRAMENEHVTMLGHVTGRLLLKREPYLVNHAMIIDCAAETRTIIELNCSPQRLDMDWRWWKRARDKGVLCSINPDAHSTMGLHHLGLGIRLARKGWLRKQDVFNTRPLKDVEAFLKLPKGRR
jgi:DNA polymerase (family 10)